MKSPFGFKILAALTTGAILLGANTSFAHPCKAQIAGEPIVGTVDKVLRAGRFSLAGSATKYRLSGTAKPIEPKSKQTIELHPVKAEADRYGAIPAQGFQNGAWMQGKSIRSGATLYYAFDETVACIAAMRKAEDFARGEKRGIWTSGNVELSATEVEKLLQRKGTLTLVKGKVLSVGDRTRRLYLNFGQKWSQDFTISVVKQGAGAFKEDTKGTLGRLLASKGKTVRIRGILEERQGPLIRLVDEAQIEILD